MESNKLFMNYRRIRHIKRCNNFRVITPTDVAQHSYFTTMLATLFVDEFNMNKCTTDIRPIKLPNTEILLRKCLFHDLEEAFTSDIPYPVKHASSEIHAHLEFGLNAMMQELIGKNNYVMKSWDSLRARCKDGVEGSIVAFCDMLELAIYCYEELCVGNTSFEVLLDNCNKYLDGLLWGVFMNLYGTNFSSFKDTEELVQLVPSIWKLRQMVSRNELTKNYVLQDFTVDIQ